MNKKQKQELRTRYLEQLPMVAAFLIEEDVKEAVAEALELIDACVAAIEETEE